MMNVRAKSLGREGVCCRDVFNHLGEFKVSDTTLFVEEAENAVCRLYWMICCKVYSSGGMSAGQVKLDGLSRHLHRPGLWPKR